jgi:hypothetical protein
MSPSYEKDMIEAEVPTDEADEAGDAVEVTRITGGEKRHQFEATCLTLDAILVTLIAIESPD